MIVKPESINLSLLPSLPIAERKKLPNCPAIYMCVSASDEILYIGCSTSLIKRWINHHQLHQLQNLDKIRIVWIDIPDITGMLIVEKTMINYFTPIFNRESREIKKPVNNEGITKKKKAISKAVLDDAERADVKTRYKKMSEIPLATRMTGVRLPVNIEAIVRSLPSPNERAAWLRRVITEAAERELISYSDE